MATLGIIPARAGSKGVPGKNSRFCAGKPLIQWTIESALNSELLDECIVTTDDPKIKKIVSALDVSVIDRPIEFAQDKSSMVDVVQHAVNVAESQLDATYDYLALLQPTAPMRRTVDIDEAVRILQASDADSVVSVYRVDDAHPARMYHIEGSVLTTFYTEPVNRLRQDLPAVYHRNGAVYVCTRNLAMNQDQVFGGKMLPYIMPKSRSANIDDESDFLIAELLLNRSAETA